MDRVALKMMVHKRDVRIRQMVAADSPAVANLATQLGYASTAAQIGRRYELMKDRPEARLLVAQDTDGSVIGWIHVQLMYLLESEPRAEILGLVVSETARGRGVGRLLVQTGEEWAAGLGMDLIVVRSNQIRIETRAFYEHLGYGVTKTQNVFRKVLDNAQRT
jgi:ribosomal protein S18 acetylase RimI-like enzyme